MPGVGNEQGGLALGVGNEQGGLACCNSWGCKESDMTERLNWTMNIRVHISFESAFVFFFKYIPWSGIARS